MRTSPYFPLEVDAFVSDEKLNDCSAEANGVYIRVLCLMHKSDEYGKVRLSGAKSSAGIAQRLSRHLPFDTGTIARGLDELLEAGVLYVEDDCLCQKRMIKDGLISEKRSQSGRLGMQRRYAAKEKPAQIVTRKKRYGAAEFEADIRSLGISEQTTKDWMENRKAKKLSPTKTAFEETKRELLSHPEYSPEEQLKLAAVKGWGGYKFKWFYNELNGNGTHENNSSGAGNIPAATEPRDYETDFR